MLTNIVITNAVTVDELGKYFNNLSIAFDGSRDSVNLDMFVYYRPTSGNVEINVTSDNPDNTLNTAWTTENKNDGWYDFIVLQGSAYDSGITYVVGDLIYDGTNYLKCVSSIDTPKAFDSNDFEIADPLDSTISDSFSTTLPYLEILRSGLALREVREKYIDEFSVSNPCKNICGYSYKIESLMQAASDEFNVFSDYSQAQKYIEFAAIQYNLFKSVL